MQLIGGKEKMVACRYEGRLGTPAAFHFSLMRDLYALQGDIGAGKYLNEHKNDVYEIPFPEGKRDIDTEEEYKALLHGAAIDR
jgi:molybdenum cofactor cytidylyltransferase